MPNFMTLGRSYTIVGVDLRTRPVAEGGLRAVPPPTINRIEIMPHQKSMIIAIFTEAINDSGLL